MDSSVHIIPREQTETLAAEWIARRECEDWGDEGEHALEAWIAADLNHRVAWLRLNAAWQKTARLRALSTTVPAGVVPAADELHLPFFPPAAKPRSGARRSRTYAVAAGVALIALAACALYFMTAGTSYRTDIGGLQTVALSDGSRVTLNTRTEIDVDVTAGERHIRLESGEAYFEVTKDASRPFVVETDERRIVVVGTQFSVRRDGEGIRVLVAEGSVRLDPDRTLLKAGAIARAEGDSVLVQQKSVAEIEQALSWRTGYLVFDRTPLGEVVAEFNRYSARQVHIADASLLHIPVGGSFRASNVDAFLRLLENELPVRVVEERRGVVLKRREGL